MPRVSSAVFDQVAKAFVGRSDRPIGHHVFLADVLLPALELVGVTFDGLTMREPGKPNVRTEVIEWPGGELWLKANRDRNGLITVTAVEVVFR
jgi:hypothetical protein